ncbi:protease inhibitor Inh/omp19 family protein [Bartonella sp. HY329]|uniref:protease inhibitor Inh/omp19 family protein n=1 Tax=unclassified Bartonella TaxID=2645622 RepID=UPI0021C782C5|nr:MULTISPECIES: protease inhibitor Inh/omp19 family protein [unclassified Bartonella]UXM95065.1 protease inhibitor Inh/omp19 family protein [Bartonella sp. HY329]UXN09388.1 protease inhibitor Inh/omp19 family protein [Bartonella sp. HY328]
MALNKISLVALALAALVTTGCMADRMGSGNYQNADVRPFPPATGTGPSASISQSELPAPSGEYPTAPGMDGQTQVASLGSEATGINLAAASIAGVWNANVGGMTCKVVTPMTKFGQGYRSAPLNCPSAISSVSSWNISGSKLEFFDASGASVATLTSQDGTHFSGQTSSGSPISLSR